MVKIVFYFPLVLFIFIIASCAVIDPEIKPEPDLSINTINVTINAETNEKSDANYTTEIPADIIPDIDYAYAKEIFKNLAMLRNEVEYMLIELGYDKPITYGINPALQELDHEPTQWLENDEGLFFLFSDDRFPDIRTIHDIRSRVESVYSLEFAQRTVYDIYLNPERPHFVEYDGSMYRNLIQQADFYLWVTEPVSIKITSANDFWFSYPTIIINLNMPY
ncbi:MAG: hypothetical protein FWE90_06700 [Defluviitaleaceae bacterium]|nr:hypothetical protein [Defluviitaleaceae bacterium]